MMIETIANGDDGYAEELGFAYEDALVLEMRRRDEVELSAASRLSAYLQVPDLAETLSNGEVILAGAMIELLDRLSAIEKRQKEHSDQSDALQSLLEQYSSDFRCKR